MGGSFVPPRGRAPRIAPRQDDLHSLEGPASRDGESRRSAPGGRRCRGAMLSVACENASRSAERAGRKAGVDPATTGPRTTTAAHGPDAQPRCVRRAMRARWVDRNRTIHDDAIGPGRCSSAGAVSGVSERQVPEDVAGCVFAPCARSAKKWCDNGRRRSCVCPRSRRLRLPRKRGRWGVARQRGGRRRAVRLRGWRSRARSQAQAR
jgi:hypothetical protein